MKKYLHYTFEAIADFFELQKFRFYRAYKGGVWYKHCMSGELPGCYGCYWARYGYMNRFTDVVAKEDYTK